MDGHVVAFVNARAFRREKSTRLSREFGRNTLSVLYREVLSALGALRSINEASLLATAKAEKMRRSTRCARSAVLNYPGPKVLTLYA